MINRIIIITLLLLFAGTVKSDQFGINPDGDTDKVYFRSTAKLEFIQGQTSDIIGSFIFNPDNSSDSVSGVLRVDLRTLKTGIETRDRHMRERNLKTDDFPYAYFELISIDNLPEKLKQDTLYNTTGHGWFYIHGFKRKLTPKMTINYSEEAQGLLRIDINTKFEIKLDEYRIDRPKALFLKLAETIEIEVIFSAFNNLEESVKLPEWIEPD